MNRNKYERINHNRYFKYLKFKSQIKTNSIPNVKSFENVYLQIGFQKCRFTC